MRIVIVGDGKVGSALSHILSDDGHDIVVIDSNRQVLRDAIEALDVMVVHGNGAALEVQRDAEVGESDLLIAATSGDETNLLCCILARKLGCQNTIARVRNPDYRDQLVFLKDELGLNMAVNPEYLAANEIFRQLQFPSFMQRNSFAKGRVEIVQVDLCKDNKLAGRKLNELYKIARVRVLVCAVERGNKVYIPNGAFRLSRGDRLFVTAPSTALAKLISNLRLDKDKVHSTLIIGGSATAYYLAKELIEYGVDVKIIEKNEARCVQLAELLPHAVIINEDGSERWILDSEGIKGVDAVITLTDKDEENLTVSMYADYMNVPKVITKINRIEYTEAFRDKGIKSVVSPKDLCSKQIARYVRAMRNTEGVSAITLHRIGKMEAIEFIADEETRHTGVPLVDVAIRQGVLIACINRREHIIIPSGTTTIEKGDTVIVATTADKMINELNDVFEEETGKRERAQ